jgi:DNA-binding MarR family transcriptional regulator
MLPVYSHGAMSRASPSSIHGPATPEAVAALRAQGGFAAALRASSHGVVRLYGSGRLLNWLMDDRGRVLFGYVALHLHYSRNRADPSSGLTPTNMKAMCAELKVCSPGRVVAMLSLLRVAGYLAPDPEVIDRRQRRLVATEKLIAFLRERWRPHFEAMAPLFPDGAAMLATLDDPASTGPLVAAMVRHFRAGFRFVTHAPDLSLFGERNAGMPILSSLIVAGRADDIVPPSLPVRISIAALARRFGVSRPHVLKLIRDAAELGLIERREGEHILMRPTLAEGAQNFFATVYLFFADCAREAREKMAKEAA